MIITNLIRCRYIINSYKNFIKENDKILDVGFGKGIIANKIKERFGADITGIDIIDENKTNLKFKKFDGCKIPFGDNEFDIAMFNDVLQVLSNEAQYNLLNEAKRVSKRILIFDDNIAKYTTLIFLSHILLYRMQRKRIPLLNFKTPDEFKEIFERLKLKIIKITYVRTPFWYPVKHIAFILEKAKK